MCASVFQHIFTALALQLHCSSDKDNKYMLDIFSLQFVRLQLEMKSNIQSFPPFAYNLSSQTFTYQYIHPSWFFERTFTHHRPQLKKKTFTHWDFYPSQASVDPLQIVPLFSPASKTSFASPHCTGEFQFLGPSWVPNYISRFHPIVCSMISYGFVGSPFNTSHFLG